MPKRFLNVEYSGTSTRINVTDMEDLSEVQDAIKAKCGEDVPGPSSRIQLYDQQGQHINKWALFNSLPLEYYDEDGPSIVIHISVPNSKQSSTEHSKNLTADEESLSNKRKRTQVTEHSVFTTQLQEHKLLTTLLKSFVSSSQLVEECIQSSNHDLLPYPLDEIQKLYVRKCYKDVFDLLLEDIGRGRKSFAISGTPGIGKSLFFIYILYRLIKDFNLKTLSLKPNRILYQVGSAFECFDLQQQVVNTTTMLHAVGLVSEPDTFYIIDGRTSEPLISTCVVLFISSPRSELYRDFVKQRRPKQWFFPVWTLGELQNCQSCCYPDLSMLTLTERHRIYGGVARHVFDKNASTIIPGTIDVALTDANVAEIVKTIGASTKCFSHSHTLLQVVVSDDGQYEISHVDIASEYVGQQLWIRHSAQMVTNMKLMFGGSPGEISRHLYEIYGHMFFSVGGQTLRCKCLEFGTITEMKLDVLNGKRITFGKDSIPTAADLKGNYYEPSDDDNFPAIDSLSQQGMFQFTVAADHPIRGVNILKNLCKLYDEPKLYFVVPPERFEKFKKQKFKAIKGSNSVSDIDGLKQFVLELPVVVK
jgi:hypothetical protein